MTRQLISNKSDPRIELFKSQRDSVLRKEGLMIVDSARVVDRLLKTQIPLHAVLGPREFLDQVLSSNPLQEQIQVFECSRDVLESIYGFRIHSGVMALAQRPEDVKLSQMGDKILCLNGVNNSENIGAIARNCLAFNATSICVDPQSCSPYVRRSIRVSMGSIFKCRVHHSKHLDQSLKELKSNGYTVFAANLSPSSRNLSDVEFPKKSVLIMGCEGDGLSEEALKLADREVHIPMEQGIDSLNVAVASGIFLHAMSNTSI